MVLLETKSALVFLSGQWEDALHLPVGYRHTVERTISSKVVPSASPSKPLTESSEAPRRFRRSRVGYGDTGQSPKSLVSSSWWHCDSLPAALDRIDVASWFPPKGLGV